ncbi:transporter substrate-binding domain-containing protein [Georgenia wangjunii]|uniref:transporter substrate-binding domain-containing protein n=1 Tax=Georgenia wangjunii TaxID=3117730 RepID=UPI002F26C8E1
MIKTARALAAAMLVLLLAGCGARIPSDPDGTLDQVRGSVLRVGVSPNEPWTEVTGDDASGLEVDLVTDFADSLDASVAWTTGGEESLIGKLERGELDLVIGGLTAASPWADKASLTTAYTFAVGPDGAEEAHVMAVPMGENAFLVELETFLLGSDVP